MSSFTPTRLSTSEDMPIARRPAGAFVPKRHHACVGIRLARRLAGWLAGVPYCLPSAPLSGRSAEVETNIIFVKWSPSANDVSEVRRPAPEAEKALQVLSNAHAIPLISQH